MLLAAIMAAAWSGIEGYRQYQLLLTQEQASAMLRRANRKPPPRKLSRADLDAERHWHTVRQELDFSWYPLFAALEHTGDPDIGLLEFIPDKLTGQLTLRGIAHDLPSLTNYLSTLSNEHIFGNVYLSHQKKQLQGNLEVISFEIRLKIME
jgi:hypothetical protein